MASNRQARRALVFGANGQDGSYLCESLMRSGLLVTGIGRQACFREQGSQPIDRYLQVDLNNLSEVKNVLHQEKPDYIYHTAAVHGASGFNYEEVWESAHRVNTLSAHACLEYIRHKSSKTSFIYLSSSKVFDESQIGTISEKTARKSTCIYSITKNSTGDLVDYYRKKHAINAGVIWLFNHDSPRRSKEYFIPKLAEILIRSLEDDKYIGEVGSLDFWCDWGSAQEYMDLVSKVGLLPEIQDYVLATGHTISGRALANELFSRFNLSYEKHIKSRVQSELHQLPPWVVDNSQIGEALSNKPRMTALDVCLDIINRSMSEVQVVSFKK